MEEKQVQQEVEKLSPKILESLKKIFNLPPEEPMEFETCPISGVGENSYGLVLRVNLKSKVPAGKPRRWILKIAPTNPARRTQMRVRNFYEREVYMYTVIFPAYRKLSEGIIQPYLIADIKDYSLDDSKEFIIFEDLTELDYIVGRRGKLPDGTIVEKVLRTIAQFHALSFALQAKKPEVFQTLIAELQTDNLFTPDIDPISIEFGKSYIRRALNMIQTDLTADDEQEMAKHLELLHNLERKFKDICFRCVDGRSCAPYSVICHGDLWGNNILIRYDEHDFLVSAKLVDFQMSRYASPVLDLVHYLFVSVDSDLRGPNFHHFIYDVYYASLGEHLRLFDLDVRSIFPLEIFQRHLLNYAIYGLCMAAFSLPFFVADETELLDLDKVAEAILDIGKSTTKTTKQNEEVDGQGKDLNQSRLKLIEEDFNLLSERTAPLFKSRMAGIVEDLVKHIYKNDVTL